MQAESAFDGVRDTNDKLLRSFEFRVYLERMRSVARTSPLGGSAADWPALLRKLESLSGLLDPLREDVKQFTFSVASAHLGLSRPAFSLRGRAYVRYCESADLRLQIDEEIPRAMGRNPLGRIAIEDDADPAGLALTALELLDAYKRRLSYTVGLVCMVRGEDPRIKGLVAKGTQVLEGMLLAHGRGLWPGLVLGDEYRHVHRGLAGRTALYSPARKAYRLRHGHSSSKHRWIGEYSSAKLTSMTLHVAAWECGWILGRLMEEAELGAFVEGSK